MSPGLTCVPPQCPATFPRGQEFFGENPCKELLVKWTNQRAKAGNDKPCRYTERAGRCKRARREAWGSAWGSRTRQPASGRSLTGLGAEPTAWHSRPAGPWQRLEQGARLRPSPDPNTDPFRASRTFQEAPRQHGRSEGRHNYPGPLAPEAAGSDLGLARFLRHSGKCSPEEEAGRRAASGPFTGCFCKLLVHT